MDAETMGLVTELADKITTIVAMLFMIQFLIKENLTMKQLLFGDWQRQREEEIEARVKARLTKELGNSGGI